MLAQAASRTQTQASADARIVMGSSSLVATVAPKLLLRGGCRIEG